MFEEWLPSPPSHPLHKRKLDSGCKLRRVRICLIDESACASTMFLSQIPLAGKRSSCSSSSKRCAHGRRTALSTIQPHPFPCENDK